MKEGKERFPAAVAVRYDDPLARVWWCHCLPGLDLPFSPQDAQGLENTTNDFGMHFPRIDADLYIPGLLQGFLGSKHWVAELGKRGGISTDAKIAAVRQNGKLGGRPRKSKGPVAA